MYGHFICQGKNIFHWAEIFYCCIFLLHQCQAVPGEVPVYFVNSGVFKKNY